MANLGLGFDYATSIEAPWEELLASDKGTSERKLAGVVEPVYNLAGQGWCVARSQSTWGSPRCAREA